MNHATAEQTITALRQLIAENGLTHRDVAELACVSIKTVESWLAQPGAANHRAMHVRHLRSVHYALPEFNRRLRSQERSRAASKT